MVYCGIAAVNDQTWLPVFAPVSPQAESIRNLFVIVLVLCAAIFLSVVVLVTLAGYRFKAAHPHEIASASFGSRKLEIAWTVGPALVVSWLAIITIKLILTINHIPKHTLEPGEPDIIITANQWWWDVRYPRSGVVTANEIHIPVGRKMRVLVRSGDVIHSLWAPRLARKIDTIPGKDNYLWLEASQSGEFDGFCAEFCGNQHARMKFRVVAQPVDEFSMWQSAQLRPLAASRAQQALAGEGLFFAQTCTNCHSIRGAEASSQATAAPDLTHLSSRTMLAAGTVTNSRENLTRWLKDPESIKPGCKMPDFNLNDEQVAQLVAFLWPEK